VTVTWKAVFGGTLNGEATFVTVMLSAAYKDRVVNKIDARTSRRRIGVCSRCRKILQSAPSLIMCLYKTSLLVKGPAQVGHTKSKSNELPGSGIPTDCYRFITDRTLVIRAHNHQIPVKAGKELVRPTD
jgi:hypothetical protein